MTTTNKDLKAAAGKEYKYGWTTDVESETPEKGLNEDIVRWISEKKNEPAFLLNWRLKAFSYWKKLVSEDKTPKWANVKFPEIDYQNAILLLSPKIQETIRQSRPSRSRNSSSLRKTRDTTRRTKTLSGSSSRCHLR